MPSLLNKNMLVGLFMALLSLLFILYIGLEYIEEPGFVKNPIMSPRWLPMVMSWCVFILSLTLCFQEWLSSSKNIDPVSKERSIDVVILIAVLIGYVLAFERLGAVLTAIVACLILFALRARRSMTLYLLAMIIPIAVYFFFTELLNVPLPRGIFDD
jgi:putative tricarboxylic transport membrane protein|tara:strand:+ start:14316 stop:14786 length:471 start_codon:yes stop_codon:yes gene_type:complete